MAAKSNLAFEPISIPTAVELLVPTTLSLWAGEDEPIHTLPELSIKTVAAVFEPPPLNCSFPEFEFSPTKVLVPPK